MAAKSSNSSLSKEEMAEKSLVFCTFAVRSITYAAMLPVAQLDEPKWGMSQLAKNLGLQSVVSEETVNLRRRGASRVLLL